MIFRGKDIRGGKDILRKLHALNMMLGGLED